VSDLFKKEEYVDFLSCKEKYESRFIYGFDSSILPLDSLIEQNTLFFSQLLLRRSYCTYQAIDNAINYKNFIQLVLCVRSLFELTGSIGYLFGNIRKYSDGEMSKNEVDEILGRLNLGFKPKTKEHPFESINVLTMIDVSDKLLNEQIDDVKNILRDSYNWLSEFCHPNSLGLIFSIEECNNRKIIFRNSAFDDKEFGILGYAPIAIISFFSFYDDTYDLIKKMKNMPKIIERPIA